MIAWAGLERLALGLTDDLAAPARARWPLDPAAEPVARRRRQGVAPMARASRRRRPPLLAALARALAPFGLILRGGLRPGAGRRRAAGRRQAAADRQCRPGAVARVRPHRSGRPGPLNRWTERAVRPLAGRFGATALFPFDGPPYWPFQRWALAAEPVRASPLGLLIHPRYGLWHAYRAALAFAATDIALPPRDAAPDLCGACAAKPCLAACPVGAFGEQGYDVPACLGHLRAPAGDDCRSAGCRARRACPIGREHAYEPAQARFHMSAFERNQR